MFSILNTEIVIPLPHQMQQKLDSGCCIAQKWLNYRGMSCFEGRRWVMMHIPLYENNFTLSWFQQIFSVKTSRYTATSVFVQISIFWPAINLNWKCSIVLLETFLCLPEVFCPMYCTSLIGNETVADLFLSNSNFPLQICTFFRKKKEKLRQRTDGKLDHKHTTKD